MVALVVVLVSALVVGIGYLSYRSRQRRIAAVTALAKQIGFTFSKNDADRIVDMPFALFRMGEGRGAELVISGTRNNLPLRIFDYWFYTETRDARGNAERDYKRFTCALAAIPATCPSLQLSHENALTRLGDHLGLHDVELEYADFNRRFRIKCDDQKFAFSLLDAQMMEWLLGADTFDRFEVAGSAVLLASPKLDPERWLDLATWFDVFHSHVPPVVYTTYPPA